MLGGGLGRQVLGFVKDWIPSRSYRAEHRFQNDLKEYLDTRLNDTGGTGLDMGLGGGQQVPVTREHGGVNADVAVGNEVGIELKRNFSNSMKHRLSGQITDYRKEFPFVIVVACGISDMGGWRELQNEYGGPGGMGMGLDQSEVHFVHKRKENFGKDPSRNRDGGFFGGGGLF